MNLFSRARGHAETRAILFGALALLAWGAAGVRAAQVFAPDSIYVQPFNSDSALPVLMADDPIIDPFRTYIYGQDQIGAYPFILCQLVHNTTGFVWTDVSVFLLQVAWLFLGVLAVAALGRPTRFVAPALFLMVLCLHPTVGHYVFVLNQRYSWQLTPLLFAWWSYRGLCARLFATSAALKTTALRSLSSFIFSLLAIWSSPLSAPMLLVFLALEVARARINATDAESAQSTDETHALDYTRERVRFTLTRLLACALPLAAGTVAEQLLKANYHRHALKHFGTDFHTPTQVDWGHFSTNLHVQLANLIAAPLWWLVVPAIVVSPFVITLLIRRLINGNAHDSSNLLSAGARLDASVLMLGSLSVALINFASAVVFLWIRLNLYGGRYLALTHLFGAFAGLSALLLLFTLPARAYAARRVVFPGVAIACALVLALKFPLVAKNPEYENLKEIAAGIAARNPRAVLLGGYWDTYVFAALRPSDALTPVPSEDQLVRTPWTPRSLRDSTEVVVVHHYFPYSGGMEVPAPYTTFGDGRDPPHFIKQHGATLRLDTPRWYEHGGYIFTLYRNVSDASAR
ncbi:MAG: hypothetical protein QOE33_1104 [Acidobacteriota bacterium]|nr:hypothetical protein [Acidobacteriota bacterium]